MFESGEGINGHYYNEERDGQNEYEYYHRPAFVPSRYYYHTLTRKLNVIHETELAYLLQDSVGKFWIPKRLCLFTEGSDTEAHIWNKFKIFYLEDE